MAYHIQYGASKYDHKCHRKKKISLWFIIISLLIVGTLSFIFPQEALFLQEKAFPFLKQEVRSAFHDMIMQIGEGTSVSDAVGAFCREIVIENIH